LALLREAAILREAKLSAAAALETARQRDLAEKLGVDPASMIMLSKRARMFFMSESLKDHVDLHHFIRQHPRALPRSSGVGKKTGMELTVWLRWTYPDLPYSSAY